MNATASQDFHYKDLQELLNAVKYPQEGTDCFSDRWWLLAGITYEVGIYVRPLFSKVRRVFKLERSPIRLQWNRKLAGNSSGKLASENFALSREKAAMKLISFSLIKFRLNVPTLIQRPILLFMNQSEPQENWYVSTVNPLHWIIKSVLNI